MADTNSKVAATQARMAELAQKFLTRSGADVAAMRESLARVGKGDAAALSHLRHLAHRMNGTGATLGFEAISDQAARLEQLIDSLPNGSTPDAEQFAQMTRAIDSLEKSGSK